ncbi:MAG: ABC transporter permease [Frankia sp.]|nr:ABC transporter permease [Frankia sp.]
MTVRGRRGVLVGPRPLTGTARVLVLGARLDRLVLSLWLATFVVLTAGVAIALAEYYPARADRVRLGELAGRSPGLLALTGPVVDVASAGGLLAWRIGGLCVLLAGLMSIFTMIRHTRAEEEAGRLELLRSAPVGRLAPPAAAVAVMTGANVALALALAVTQVACGLPVVGSLVFGASVGAGGVFFGALAALTAQLTEGARAARMAATTVLGLAYLLRAVGDATAGPAPASPLPPAGVPGVPGGPGAALPGAVVPPADPPDSALSWASPIGWAQRVRPFGDGEVRWWVFALLLGASVVLLVVALWLLLRRDIGAGFLASRPGRATATPRLAGVGALAARLHRGSVATWTVGYAVAGATLGVVAHSVADVLSDNPAAREAIVRYGAGGAVVDAYLTAMFNLLGLAAAGFAVAAAYRIRAEELVGLAEAVLATATSRLRFAASHLWVALAAPVLPLAAAGLAAGLAHGLQIGDVANQTGRLFAAAIVQLPAVWAFAGLATALIGLAPRRFLVVWVALVVCLLLGQLGPTLRLDQWVMDLSPFTHLPRLPGAGVTATPLIVLPAVAVALVAAGLAGLRRRDIQPA